MGYNLGIIHLCPPCHALATSLFRAELGYWLQNKGPFVWSCASVNIPLPPFLVLRVTADVGLTLYNVVGVNIWCPDPGTAIRKIFPTNKRQYGRRR